MYNGCDAHYDTVFGNASGARARAIPSVQVRNFSAVAITYMCAYCMYIVYVCIIGEAPNYAKMTADQWPVTLLILVICGMNDFTE